MDAPLTARARPGVELAEYEIEECFATSSKVGAVGPVTILYADLLRGSQR